jgi:UDP-glucose 4-epimerase
MAKCLVLGANGFIGSHLVDSLVSRNHSVRAFDRFGSDPRFKPNGSVDLYYGDFLNSNDLAKSLKDIEYVFHFISTTNPATSEDDPLIDLETNIRMSIELFKACVEIGTVKRIIFASSGGAIYGNSSSSPHKETDNPLPVSPYSIGKLTIEHYLHYFKVKHGLDSIVLRIANPYGERQSLHRKQGVIPIFLDNINAGHPITVLGDGTMVRDYIYVKDVATMTASMFDKDAKQGLYNLGSGTGFSVNEIVEAVEKVSNMSADIIHEPVPPTFVEKVVLDTTRFKEEFDLSPETSLADGLSATLDYIKESKADKHE